MVILTMKSSDGKYVYTKEFENSSTVLDVKEYIIAQMSSLSTCRSKITKILFGGKERDDSMVICTMEPDALIVEYELLMETYHDAANVHLSANQNNDNMQFVDDIPTSDMSIRVAVLIEQTRKKIMVEPEDLVMFNGKMYLVKDRRKVLTMKNIIDCVRKIEFSKEDATKLLVFFVLLSTGNGAIVFILGCIFALEIMSRKLCSDFKDVFKQMDHGGRTFYMFFVSMFAIDHAVMHGA
ncbi:hypothetical protein M896_030980 [Ordospora colligata OC4]|uniref:Ubiquitin-like domain-containing protein n=1 Tax=Ordospora colligata OC4 TaxID=1354746 RepID=A0A0B2UGA2_9MICR|nr:uncharacterized protein M896_030980 [Ordospora colligata OC4]KHN70111.1 hypothetical protein M896_030980 [Ordospora colligata OC4]TBU16678.1 hypothetical protein CWI40_031340 [Ordospora colligata]